MGRVLRRADESVHAPAVYVDPRLRLAVRAAAVPVAWIVEGLPADPGPRVRHADGRLAVPHRDTPRARIGPEVAVERAVLLHDDHHVADLVDRVWP